MFLKHFISLWNICQLKTLQRREKSLILLQYRDNHSKYFVRTFNVSFFYMCECVHTHKHILSNSLFASSLVFVIIFLSSHACSDWCQLPDMFSTYTSKYIFIFIYVFTCKWQQSKILFWTFIFLNLAMYLGELSVSVCTDLLRSFENCIIFHCMIVL